MTFSCYHVGTMYLKISKSTLLEGFMQLLLANHYYKSKWRWLLQFDQRDCLYFTHKGKTGFFKDLIITFDFIYFIDWYICYQNEMVLNTLPNNIKRI